MLQRLLQQLRHFVTALGLLALCVMVAELWLRSTRPMRTPQVAAGVTAFRQKDLIPSATLHHQMRPLAAVNNSTGAGTFATNSLGLRGKEPAIPATQGTFRILLLGDEAVTGPWLAEDETLSAQLQRQLALKLEGPVEVINAGVPGFSPLLSYLQYEQQLWQLAPDLIILHLDMSDVADEAQYRPRLRRQGSRQACMHALLDNPREDMHPLVGMFRESAVAQTLLSEMMTNAQSVELSERYHWTKAEAGRSVTEVRLMMQSVSMLRKRVQSRGRQLIVTSSPVPWQVMPPQDFPQLCKRYKVLGEQAITSDGPFQLFAAWGRAERVPVCSVVTAFRKFEHPRKLFRRDMPRLSRYGTALQAHVLAKKIVETPAVVAGRLRSPL